MSKVLTSGHYRPLSVHLPIHMNSLIRQFSITLILLLVFLTAALTAQAWLQRETRRLQADTVAAKRAQFLQALEIARRPPETWDDAFQRQLGAMLEATVVLRREAAPAPPASPGPGLLGFDHRIPGEPGFHAQVTFPAPAAARLIALHNRIFVAVILLALLLLLVSVALSLPRRTLGDGVTRVPWAVRRAEIAGLERFARISVERGEALARESGARQRAEEDLQISRNLLGQSIEERVQLGRNLHDNICQTLYAVSLTLEGMRTKMAGGDPADTTQPLDQSIAELRRLNREVRSYIQALEPDTVQSQPFMEALDSMLATQPCPEGTRLVRNVDKDAAALIVPERAIEVVNILREAISNSLRHGRARTITVHARCDEGTVVLAVQDDGAGFDAAAVGNRGHGLGNMEARAAALGGTVRVVSATGKGTRVLLTLPVTSAS
jgi:signal transduction histidine kinase